MSRYGVLCPRDCTVPAPCYAAQDYSILRSCSFQISRSTWRRARVVVYPHRKCAASEHVTPLGTSAERHVLAGCTCRNATAPPAHAVPSCPRIAHSRMGSWDFRIVGNPLSLPLGLLVAEHLLSSYQARAHMSSRRRPSSSALLDHAEILHC